MPLNNDPCRVRSTVIHLNHIEIYYAFRISVCRYNGSCIAVDVSYENVFQVKKW